jgi:hypothetical protein
MKRREFIKLLGMAGLTAMSPWPRSLARAQSAPYTGPLFVSIAAGGAWDVTSFCDPKENVGGEPEINHWSRNASTRSVAGTGIDYAPFAINSEFFDRFGSDMLVINGVDAQTNSHDVGVRHNWSGRIPHGYPTFAAVAATALGTDLPLAYLSSGGYRETAGLTPYTVVQDTRSLRDLVNPNFVTWGDVEFHDQDDLDLIAGFQSDRLTALRGRPDLLPRTARGIDSLLSARANRDQLASLTSLLPESPVDPTDKDGYWNPLLRQAEIALIAYSAGLTVAADLITYGFDTHQNHDADQAAALTVLVNGINFLFDRAETMGIADRLVVLVSSDFGRTPHYNDDNGKDHWPIGSAVFIQQGATWGGRTVGLTDGGHNAMPINPSTLAVDATSNGVYIRPKHIHEAFRRLAGVDAHSASSAFDLDAESFDFFNPALST